MSIAGASSRSSSTRHTRARADGHRRRSPWPWVRPARWTEDETAEDVINRLMESRKLLPNASYFAFTATPKNKTLEIFGDPLTEGAKTRHTPFHSYTMKQAIQEGFIIDVLRNYTPVDSYYRLVKTVEGDPEFDTKRAGKKLRRYVEDNDHAIRLKAEIMGGPLPRAGGGPSEDRRPGASDGRHEQRSAGHQLLRRYPQLPDGAQEPVSRRRRLLGASTSTEARRSRRRPSMASPRT